MEEAVGAGLSDSGMTALTGLVVWTSLEEVAEERVWVVAEERAALEEEDGRCFSRSPSLATVFRGNSNLRLSSSPEISVARAVMAEIRSCGRKKLFFW